MNRLPTLPSAKTSVIQASTSGFDCAMAEVYANTTRIAEDRKVFRHVAEALARNAAAREHFMRRAETFPKSAIDSLAVHVAAILARNARLVSKKQFELIGPLTGIAVQHAKLHWSTFADRLRELEKCGLIRIAQWGSGLGRPFIVELVVTDQHWQEIDRIASNLVADYLDAESKSSGPVGAIST